MRNKITLTLALIFAVVGIFGVSEIFRNVQPVHAQDTTPPPDNDRISFGMLGITSGQVMRITVSNTAAPNDANIPPPCRVVLNFRGMNGQLIRNGRGDVIRRVVMLEAGNSTFLDVNYDDLQPGSMRLQLRAIVTVQPPPDPDSPPDPCHVASTVEVIASANGRTQFAVTGLPAIQRLSPPPEPD